MVFCISVAPTVVWCSFGQKLNSEFNKFISENYYPRQLFHCCTALQMNIDNKKNCLKQLSWIVVFWNKLISFDLLNNLSTVLTRQKMLGFASLKRMAVLVSDIDELKLQVKKLPIVWTKLKEKQDKASYSIKKELDKLKCILDFLQWYFILQTLNYWCKIGPCFLHQKGSGFFDVNK